MLTIAVHKLHRLYVTQTACAKNYSLGSSLGSPRWKWVMRRPGNHWGTWYGHPPKIKEDKDKGRVGYYSPIHASKRHAWRRPTWTYLFI